MMAATNHVEVRDVEVIVGNPLVLLCRVDGKVVSVPTARLMPGTEVSQPGDRGMLVLAREVARQFSLI